MHFFYEIFKEIHTFYMGKNIFVGNNNMRLISCFRNYHKIKLSLNRIIRKLSKEKKTQKGTENIKKKNLK